MWRNNLPKTMAVSALASATGERPTIILAAVIARSCGQDVLPFVLDALQGVADFSRATVADVNQAALESRQYLSNPAIEQFIAVYRTWQGPEH